MGVARSVREQWLFFREIRGVEALNKPLVQYVYRKFADSMEPGGTLPPPLIAATRTATLITSMLWMAFLTLTCTHFVTAAKMNRH